jgi:fatty-acyl-CoA synthase
VGAARFGIEPGDVYVDPMPLYHVGGHFVALEILGNDATYVMVDAVRSCAGDRPHGAGRATLTVAVPTMLVSLLEQEGIAATRSQRLRAVSSGGAGGIGRSRAARATRVRCCGHGLFGQTECCGSTSQTRLDDPPELVEQTIGVPVDGVDVRVVDPETVP